MPQDNIVELLIGQNGSLVTGDIFVDYTTNSISGPGLSVQVGDQLVGVDALTLHDNGNGTYTIAGASLAVGSIPAAAVELSLGSTNPSTLTATATILGVATVQIEAVLGAVLPCFASGTLIATVRGEVAVEDLVVGDRAVTSSGAARPIVWLGHRTVSCRSHARPHEAMPVRIAAHAFGDGKPSRDLYVSPGHSICVDITGEVLIPASALINGSTVLQVEVEEIGYWHVELDGHDILLANGLPAESYLEMSNRSFFAQGEVVTLAASPDVDTSHRTHADFCRPYHDSGELVEAAKALLRDRASGLGWARSCELVFHLEVDGRRVDPVIRGAMARFRLPADAKEVWLVSPTARPSDTIGSLDVRDLGLQLASIRIDDGLAALRDISIDDPLLCIGLYGVEEKAYRWTAGRALLPAALWQGCAEDFYLRVELAGPPVPRWRRAIKTLPALAFVA